MSHHAVETDEAHPEGRAEKEGDKETEVVVEQTDRSLKKTIFSVYLLYALVDRHWN